MRRRNAAALIIASCLSCAPTSVRLPGSTVQAGTRSALVGPQPSSPRNVADRVVAVVGPRAILLSELNEHARAYPSRTLNAALDELVSDELIQQQAARMNVTVPDDAVEREARVRACGDAACRDALRRQLLEGMLLKLRLAGRVHVTDDDARLAYMRFLATLTNADKSVELEVATFPATQRALATQVVAQARAGRNLCVLAQCYSRGLQPMRNIIPNARAALASMNDGDVSDPIDIGTTVVIVMRLKKRATPSFDDVREEMRDRATEDAILRERGAWLQELRAATHVELKL